MEIFIKNKDFWEQPITVQRIQIEDDETEVEWCNHANAKLNEEVHDMYLDNQTIHFWVRIWSCDRCDAYKEDGSDEWINAPIGGSYE